MATCHALIKRLAAVETLGSTTVICTDKTGTLTKAEMTVTALWESGRRHSVSGAGYKPEGVVSEPDQVTELLRGGAQCCDARLLGPDPAHQRDWRILGDTTEGAIIVAAAKAGIDAAAANTAAPRIGVFTNRRLLLAGAFGIALVSCISYIPLLQSFFGTAGLTVWDWLMLVGFGLALLLADECRKAVVRHRRSRPRVNEDLR